MLFIYSRSSDPQRWANCIDYRYKGSIGSSVSSATPCRVGQRRPPELDEVAQAGHMREALALAPKYRIENMLREA